MTIVEVVIAVLVLMVVATAIGMATVDGSKQRGASRLQSSLTAAGQHVQEDVIADRGWMTDIAACQTLNRPCDISRYVSAEALELTDVDATARLSSATATALDSDVARLGRDDEDGVIPDYYRISVVLQVRNVDAARLRLPVANSARRFVTTIDRRGAEQVGSVAVEICRVVNQADERMNLQGCANGPTTHVSMLNCEPTDALCDAAYPDVFGDCDPGASEPCLTAFRWINHFAASDAGAPAPFVSLNRIRAGSVRFDLVDQSSGARIPSARAERVGGLLVFQNVPAGEFKLAGLPDSVGGNSERWTSKELPGFHGSPTRTAARATIAVEPGIQSRALVMFRPAVTDDGIDLVFDRKTRTFRLKGPLTHPETSVEKYAPTNGYEGARADDYCGLMKGARTDQSQFTTYNCVGLRPYGLNCVDLYVEGEFFRDVGEGNGDTYFLYPDVVTGEIGSGSLLRLRTNGPTLASRFCTYYAEYLTHTYWGDVDRTPPYDLRDGAAKANTYDVKAAPFNRHVEYDNQGPFIETPQCVVPRKGQCTDPTPASRFVTRLGDGLPPGLNTRMNAESDDAAETNSHFSGTPPWLENPMWVHPDGSIQSSLGGTQPAGVDVRLTGLGECYWRSPKFPGEVIEADDCNPCSPLWTRTERIVGACAVLTRTEWERPAWERYTSFDWTGDGTGSAVSAYFPIQGQEGVIDYDPPWRCTSMLPKVENGATCSPQPTRPTGVKGIPGTRHRDSGGGTGTVMQNAFDAPGTT